MKESKIYLSVEEKAGRYILRDITGKIRKDVNVRDIMCEHCIRENQCIEYDTETGRSYRKSISLFNKIAPSKPCSASILWGISFIWDLLGLIWTVVDIKIYIKALFDFKASKYIKKILTDNGNC